MKILIEIPDNWLDSNKLDDLSFITRTCKQEVQKRLVDLTVEKIWAETKIPEIEISREEIKAKLLDRMVDKIEEKNNE